ncbi:MAG TPA: GntR family transcriptional regulator [Candidatus Baltobacteraceae bacterium]
MSLAFPPLYYRIQEMLRQQIASGELAVGARVPSESELAERFETTRSTVRQALAHLTFEGLIVRRVGHGTFVAKPQIEGHLSTSRPISFEEQMEEAGVRVGFRLISFEEVAASEEMASALQVAPKSHIFRLQRLRLVDGEIVGYEDRALPQRIGKRIPASSLTNTSAMAMTESAMGARFSGAAVTVAAEPSRAKIARLLAIRVGTPILLRMHTFFDQNGVPALTGSAYYRADKFRFTFRFGRTS